MPQHPHSIATRFTTDRKEALTEQLNLRVSPSMKSKIKNTKNWQERVREAIAQILEEEENIKSA